MPRTVLTDLRIDKQERALSTSQQNHRKAAQDMVHSAVSKDIEATGQILTSLQLYRNSVRTGVFDAKEGDANQRRLVNAYQAGMMAAYICRTEPTNTRREAVPFPTTK